MKLENESIFFKSTLSDKPPSKVSEPNNDALYSGRLKIENEENHDQISCDDINLDNHLQCTTRDENGWNTFKEDSSSIDSSDNDDVKAVNVESFEKDSELYTEKSVPECDLPKLIVCSEESSCDIVKDICIDERMNPCSSPVKVVFESDENEDNQNYVLVKELEFTDITMADELKISEDRLSEKDSIDQTNFNELIPVMLVECDENDSNMKANLELEPCDSNDNDAGEEHSVELKISEDRLSEKDSIDQTDFNELIPVMLGECDENYSNMKANLELEPCNSNDNDAGEEHSVEMSSEIENRSTPSSTLAFEELKNDSGKSSSPDPVPKYDNPKNDLSSDAKTEKESLTFKEIIISESSKLFEVEDGPSSQIQHGIGESSFSSAVPLASLINYSSPVAYSGNLSIRSDSSTTSTRSFAFPILQTEWHHNSPVRMAEADRRFFRKHKGWRQGLFCCRF